MIHRYQLNELHCQVHLVTRTQQIPIVNAYFRFNHKTIFDSDAAVHILF